MKKTYSKTKNVCKVTFSCPEKNAQSIYVVGDFNNWNPEATPMTKGKSGFSTTVELEPGRTYQFRYLIDGQRWENDNNADEYADTPFQDAKNCVIAV